MKCVSLTLSLLAMLLMTSPALAQDAPAASPASASRSAESQQAYDSLGTANRALLDKLNDADEAVRDEALTALLAGAPDDALLDRLYRASVSPEQRTRLRQVAVHHAGVTLGQKFSGPEDGAILGMSPVPQSVAIPQAGPAQPDEEAAANTGQAVAREQVSGLAVRWTFPGSPAFAHLRQGDVITQIDHRPLQTLASEGDLTTRFIQYIAQKKAGAPLSLQVIRHGRVEQVTLTLGSEAALRSLYDMSAGKSPRQYAPEYAAAIEKRLAELEAITPSTAPWVIEKTDVQDAADASKKSFLPNAKALEMIREAGRQLQRVVEPAQAEPPVFEID